MKNLEQFRERLQELADEFGGLAEFVQATGVDAGHARDVLYGFCEPNEKFLASVGYERVVHYKRKRRKRQ